MGDGTTILVAVVVFIVGAFTFGGVVGDDIGDIVCESVCHERGLQDYELVTDPEVRCRCLVEAP